jgi:hypothetical protein
VTINPFVQSGSDGYQLNDMKFDMLADVRRTRHFCGDVSTIMQTRAIPWTSAASGHERQSVGVARNHSTDGLDHMPEILTQGQNRLHVDLPLLSYRRSLSWETTACVLLQPLHEPRAAN